MTDWPSAEEATYRIVRNRCHIHNPPSRQMAKRIAQGWQVEHTILTIEAFDQTTDVPFLGFRMTEGNACWRYSRIEEPANLTEWDRTTLEKWFRFANETPISESDPQFPYAPKFKECAAAAIAKLDAAPRPEKPVVMRRRHVMHSAQAFAIVSPFHGDEIHNWIFEIPYSVYHQRQKRGLGQMREWNPSEWLPTNNPVRFLGE